MSSVATKAPYLLAIACGALLAYLGTAFWGIYVVVNPINDWLIENLATQGRTLAYYLFAYSHDIIVSIIFAIPFAYLLSRIPPRYAWRYVWIAVVTALVLQYWRVFADPIGLKVILRAYSFYIGVLISTFTLPAAFLIVRKLRRENYATK